LLKAFSWGRGEARRNLMRRFFAPRRAGEELRKSEARYRTVVDAAFDAIVTITPEGIVRGYNRGAERIFGHAAEEVIGQPVTVLMPERYRDLCVAGLHQYLRTGEARVVGGTTELVGLRSDDSEFPIEMSLGETHEDGERLFTGVIRDITARKRTEDVLREARDRFRSVFDHAPIGMAVVSLEGQYLQVNRSLCEILGYSEDELLASTWQEITHPDDLPASLAYARQVIEGDIPRYHLEKRFLRADGHTVWASLSVSLVRDSEGEPLYLVSQIQDVTERKEAEAALQRSEANLAAAQQMAHLGSWEWNVETGELSWSDEAFRIFGFGPQDFAPTYKRFLKCVHHEDRERVERTVREVLCECEPYEVEFRVILRPDGSERTVLSQVEVVLDETGSPAVVLGTIHDVTERKRFQEALELLFRQHQMVLEAAGEGIFGLDLQGKSTFVNPAAARMTGWAAEELLGRPQHDLLHHSKPDGTPYPSEECPIHAALEDGVTHSRGDEVFWRKDGTSFPVEYTSTPILEDDEVVGAVVTFKDITERRTLEEQLHYQAFHDPLTGLANRALFMDRLEHALTRANRRGKKVAVLFTDLDNFKVINDSLGHNAGDQLLVAAAERLKACLRPEDTAARLGGDEFTILVEDVDGVHQAVQVAERIAEILQPPFTLEEQEVFVTTSIGVALSSPAQEQPEDLLRHADLAMYRAKHRGKARYEVFEPSLDANVVERLILETELRRALVRQQFRVYYQPIVALESGRTAGVEALVRWEHPKRGLLLPEEFLSIAEETGLIVRIGQWVLREACKQARLWQERYPGTPPLTISVNLSTREFFHPGLVAEILGESEIDPATLQLEITEGAITSNGTYWVDDTLRNLKHMGVQLAIDDFGLGYSSLSYLKRFPVDFLKIDRSFVKELGREPNGVSKDTKIVRAMIELTHALDLKVIAEGVEDAEQLRRLRQMKCDFAQGNYFSEPLPNERLSHLLEKRFTDRR
jgi:diguanylate cyclase (GGDEF)-like protein/PAS domain S-box-containing protein